MRFPFLILGLALLLAGCAVLPRGAALRSEVLASPGARAEAADFTVAPVTRETLPIYVHWPAPGEADLRWIERIDQPDSRIIAPGDAVTVTIWNAEENGLLTVPGQRFVTLPEIRISPSGSVFLPYVGERRIAGMSPERARTAIEEAYVSLIPSAQVQLDLSAGRLSTVSLIGGVASPGSYPLPDRDFTVMGLIAQGGGIDATLENPQIRLQRGGRIYGTSVVRLLDEPRLDTTLVGGDMVYVEEDERYFLSLGAAGTEAMFEFPRDRVSALDALSIIGGVSDIRADAQGILILRHYPASAVAPGPSGPDQPRVVFTIDLTSADGLFSAGQFPIRSGDLVYVAESPVTAAGGLIGLIGSAFGLVNLVSN